MSWLVRLRVPCAESEGMSWRLWDAGTTGVAELAGTGGTVELLAGFDNEDLARSTAAGLASADRLVTIEPVDSFPTPRPTTLERDGVSFTIDPGQAFGHGRHPTTELALDLVHAWTVPGRSLLDVGTGTGVLAIVAALLGASPVVGVDNDNDAIEVAECNVHRNGVAVEISDQPLSTLDATFDVVIANMLAADLTIVANDLTTMLADGGRLLLTGFLADQLDDVLRLFPGSSPLEHHHRQPWMGLVLA